MEKITAVIITKDEDRNIGRCLESLTGVADAIVVVDSGSADGTEAICRDYAERYANLRFLFHEWEGYAGQKNFADEMVTEGWILSIDADEALSEETRRHLLELKTKGLDAGAAYSICRLNNYCGHWLRHGGWRPDEAVRLWPAGAARWEGLIHEGLAWQRDLRRERLRGDLLHYSYYTVEEHARRTLKYAELSALKAFERGKRSSRAAVLLYPGWTFVRNYFLKLGFLDGWAGLVACRISAFYKTYKYSRLLDLERQRRNENKNGEECAS